MAKKIDYEGMLVVYDNISKQRPLTDDEIDRFLELKRKRDRQADNERYREENREEIRRKDRERARKPEIQARHREQVRAARAAECPKRRITEKKARDKWKGKNADKIAAKLANQKRIRDQIIATEGGILKNADKLDFWQRQAQMRELTIHEKARVRELERRADPNSSTNIAKREANKRFRERNPGYYSKNGKGKAHVQANL